MDRQIQIIKAFNNDFDLVLSKSDIIERESIYYYANCEKHVGHTLTRMVKNGSIERVKRGFYKLGKNKKDYVFARVNEDNPNQTKLFL